MGRNTFWDRDESLAHYFFTFFTVKSVDIAMLMTPLPIFAAKKLVSFLKN